MWRARGKVQQGAYVLDGDRFEMSREIEFADLDAYCVCHFTSFIQFFETATFRLLKQRGVLEILKPRGLRFAVRNVDATYSRVATSKTS